MRWVFAVFAVFAVVGLGLAALLIGHADLADEQLRAQILALRGWRAAAAGLAGAALAVAGVLVQGLFRNPLASPSVLGATAGAALGGQVVLFAHAAMVAALPWWVAPEAVLPLGCLVGAGLTLLVVVGIAGRSDDPITVLLAGVIVATLLAGVGALITALALDAWQIGRALIAFGLGGVSQAGPAQVVMAAPLVGIGIVMAWSWAHSLDLMLSGVDEAASLGVDTASLTRWMLVWTAVLVGAAVAVAGGVAFVGLIVPHVVRSVVGHHHRLVIPAAAVGGAVFVIGADVVARSVPGGELPLGVITALVGAPVFLLLLARARRQGWLA